MQTGQLRILSIGSNPISAFFSWRMQASHAAEVTLVWRSNFEAVLQYGISFRSDVYDSDRFKPFKLVRTIEDAATEPNYNYDYIFVCVKVLPDIYDLASVIAPVVKPSHTCIILNTTSSIGIEKHIMESFPRNMVLSLCSGVNIVQTGPTEFDHTGSQEVWVGAVSQNEALPLEAQQDMIESLVLTLEAGVVACHHSENIVQQQWEKMASQIAFNPLSVLLQEPNYSTLASNPQVRDLISNVIDECVSIAKRQNCRFPKDFKESVISSMVSSNEARSIMYQDFAARRPMEIETHLGIPIQIAQEYGVQVPHLKMIYAVIQFLNKTNQARPPSPQRSPIPPQPLKPQFTGNSTMGPRKPLARGFSDGVVLQNGVRNNHPPPQANGYPGNNGRYDSLMMNGHPQMGNYRQSQQQQPPPPAGARRNQLISHSESLEGLEEFANIALYNDLVPTSSDGQVHPREPGLMRAGQNAYPSPSQTREPTMTVGSNYPPSNNGYPPSNNGYPPNNNGYSSNNNGYPPNQRSSRPSPGRSVSHQIMQSPTQQRSGVSSVLGRKMNKVRNGPRYDNDDDDDDDDFIPSVYVQPPVDPDSVDMMSLTRRGKQAINDRTSTWTGDRPKIRQTRNTTSASIIGDIPTVGDSLAHNPLFAYGGNRYGNVDSSTLAGQQEKRANSIMGERFNSMSLSSYSQVGGGAYPSMRQSMPSPQNRVPPNNPYVQGVVPNRGKGYASSPALMSRNPMPRQGQPSLSPKDPNGGNQIRSVTGSASASFGSLPGNGSASSSSSLEKQSPS